MSRRYVHFDKCEVCQMTILPYRTIDNKLIWYCKKCGLRKVYQLTKHGNTLLFYASEKSVTSKDLENMILKGL